MSTNREDLTRGYHLADLALRAYKAAHARGHLTIGVRAAPTDSYPLASVTIHCYCCGLKMEFDGGGNAIVKTISAQLECEAKK